MYKIMMETKEIWAREDSVSYAEERNIDYGLDKELLLVGTTNYDTQTENIKHFDWFVLSQCTVRMLTNG
jgi:hypothetical protein